MAEVFACSRCGECCRGVGGIVLRTADAARLAAFFGISVPAFLERHAERAHGKFRLRVKDDGACVFASRALCAVHGARPDICRAWPFFRGNLVDPVSFFMAAQGCAGIGRAVSFSDFVRSGARCLLENGIYAGPHEKNAPAALLCDAALITLLEE